MHSGLVIVFAWLVIVVCVVVGWCVWACCLLSVWLLDVVCFAVYVGWRSVLCCSCLFACFTWWLQCGILVFAVCFGGLVV